MRSKQILAPLMLAVLLGGCIGGEKPQGDGVEVRPSSWRQTCDYSTEAGAALPCRFEPAIVHPQAPETAICTGEYTLNGATVSFLFDPTKDKSWMAFQSNRSPISGVIATRDDFQQVAYFIDAPPQGAIMLPWNGIRDDLYTVIYWDFLHWKNTTYGPEHGEQEFFVDGRNLYSIHKWEVESEEFYIAQDEDGTLLNPNDDLGPNGWTDFTGTTPATISILKFIIGTLANHQGNQNLVHEAECSPLN